MYSVFKLKLSRNQQCNICSLRCEPRPLFTLLETEEHTFDILYVMGFWSFHLSLSSASSPSLFHWHTTERAPDIVVIAARCCCRWCCCCLRWWDNTLTLEQRSLFQTWSIRNEEKMCKKTEKSEGFLPFCLLVLLVVHSSILNFRFVNHLPTIHLLSTVKRLKKMYKKSKFQETFELSKADFNRFLTMLDGTSCFFYVRLMGQRKWKTKLLFKETNS